MNKEEAKSKAREIVKRARQRCEFEAIKGNGPINQYVDQVLFELITNALLQAAGTRAEVISVGGIKIIPDLSIPQDEAHFINERGELVGKITGLGRLPHPISIAEEEKVTVVEKYINTPYGKFSEFTPATVSVSDEDYIQSQIDMRFPSEDECRRVGIKCYSYHSFAHAAFEGTVAWLRSRLKGEKE